MWYTILSVALLISNLVWFLIHRRSQARVREYREAIQNAAQKTRDTRELAVQMAQENRVARKKKTDLDLANEFNRRLNERRNSDAGDT